jgi:hypothetical protein
MLVGSVLTPLVTGSGSADPSAIADRLVRAWTRKDARALCAQLHPRFRLEPRLFGADCSIVADSSNVRRVTPPGLEGWSPDGTAIVAVALTSGGETLTMHHVVTPLDGRHLVTGLLFDFEEIATILLRPI